MGKPIEVAKSPTGPIKFGPSTDPIVEAQTTNDKLRARLSCVARSTAA